MKKLFLSLLIVLLPLVAFADVVEIDGIYYNLDSEAKEAEVTSNPNYFSGRVDIPASIAYDGVEYSVTSIHSEAFSFCSALTSVSIPSSMTWIKYSAFIYCRNLTSVYISDIAAWCSIDFTNNASNPLAYGAELYLNGQVIKDLTIPDNVTKIGAYAFSGCSSLTSVTIPGGVTSIGGWTFSDCISLTSVSIPSSVTSIGNSAFLGCSSLTSVTIPSGVKTIETGTFRNCTSLTSVTIPSGVKTIRMDAFLNCSSLTSVTIPEGVTSIEGWAFCHCTSLTSVTIPSGVTMIERNTFDCCSSLSSVTIGSSVRYIYSKAFASCPELTDVFCLAENVPSTESDAFQDTHIEYATLHVPDSSIDAYKREEPWKNFKDIVSLDVQSIRNLQYASPADCIDIYSIDGRYVGSAADQSEAARIINNLPSGTSTIVKKGGKSVKIMVK